MDQSEKQVVTVPAEEWAARYGFTTDAIISRIRTGILDGRKDAAGWVVIDYEATRQEHFKNAKSERSGRQRDDVRRQERFDTRLRKTYGTGKLRVKLFSGIFAIILAWEFISHKSGYHYSRIEGFHRQHAQLSWGDAFSEWATSLPLYIFLLLTIVALSELMFRYRTMKAIDSEDAA